MFQIEMELVTCLPKDGLLIVTITEAKFISQTSEEIKMKIFSLLIAIIRALDFDDCKYSNTACLAVPKYCKINEESGCTLVIVKNLGREIQINMTRSTSGMAKIMNIREKGRFI